MKKYINESILIILKVKCGNITFKLFKALVVLLQHLRRPQQKNYIKRKNGFEVKLGMGIFLKEWGNLDGNGDLSTGMRNSRWKWEWDNGKWWKYNVSHTRYIISLSLEIGSEKEILVMHLDKLKKIHACSYSFLIL